MRGTHVLAIDTAACIGCGLCLRDCPTANIALDGTAARIVAQDCIMCAHCVAVCPKAAVSATGFDELPEEINGPTALDPDDLLRALKTRRSIRQFSDRPVDSHAIQLIIEAGRLTPTGGNAQDVSYLVIKDSMERIEAKAVRLFQRLLPLARPFSSLARRVVVDDRFFFKKAPIAIAVVARDRVNGALAASNMALMAEAHGLGVLYSGFFCTATRMSRSLRKELGLRGGERVVATLVIGHPAIRYRRTAPKESACVRNL